jgi:hypothetical protein
MKHVSKVTLVLAATLLGATATTAFAGGNWAANHPRREQVNDRLQNQNRRINQEVREGQITQGQAKQLHQEDHAIRQEERSMPSKNRLISKKMPSVGRSATKTDLVVYGMTT